MSSRDGWRIASKKSGAALLFFLAAIPAWAEPTNLPALHSDLPSVGFSALRALAALALVLAVFFGGIWAFRNSQRLMWRKTGEPKLAILESRALGNRLALYVVGYEQQRFLVGSSPAGLNLLSPLPQASPAENPKAEPALSFGQQLQRLIAQT